MSDDRRGSEAGSGSAEVLRGMVTTTLRVNGEPLTVAHPVHHTLLEVLREECGLTGTKHGCELGECGTCTVLVGGKPVLSCLVLASEIGGEPVETVEGLQHGNKLDPLQEAFADLGAAQCGYCTPGILMAAKALVEENPDPSTDDIVTALAGNLCRCTGYHKIIEAVELGAAWKRGERDRKPRTETIYGDDHNGTRLSVPGRSERAKPTEPAGGDA